MCMIVDANKLGEFLSCPSSEESGPIYKWMDRGWGVIVYSTDGRFREVGEGLRKKLSILSQSGKAILIDARNFLYDEEMLREDPDLISNDPHVLALARATGTRLLYTEDGDLIKDFKNKKFLDRPRGKIYSSRANSRLLSKDSCRAGKSIRQDTRSS